MNQRLEKNIEAYFVKKVKQLGGLTIKTGTKGFPDRTAIFSFGIFHLVELKSETGATRKLQKAVHKKLKKQCGIKVWVIRTKTGVDAFAFAVEREIKFRQLKANAE